MRACALTLVALAAAPFTAPFSTCDLGLLMARRVVHSEPVDQSSQEPSIADAAFSLTSVDDTCKTLKNLGLAHDVVPFAAAVHGARASHRDSPHRQIRLSLVSSAVLRI
jgi:hypothetical protein